MFISRAFLPRVVAWAGAALFIAAAAGVANLRGASVPTPAVTGPLPASALGDPGRDYPFYASVVDLKSRGYVEEEFFIEGTANRYTTPALATATVLDGGHPFRTRIVVRRPATAARFNGTAIVEWNNVTAGRDLDIDWFQTNEHLVASGYAWVGVSPQRVGVEALKVWSAKRYATLDVTHGGTVAQDDLSFDVFAQAGQAVRSAGKVMGGLRIDRLFATGHSQSAGRLGTYVNSVHPLGKVFDAVILHGGGSRVRTDLDIPVWKLLAETDVQNQAANRQPDTNRFRTWEVAGNSHVDIKFTSYSRQLAARDGSPSAPTAVPAGGRGGRGPAAAASAPARGLAAGATTSQGGSAPLGAVSRGGASGNAGACDRPPYSHVPFHHVFNAAIDHLVRWVKDGTPPPSAPPIELTTVGPPAVMARDAAGNALGGIRLAHHAVPIAVNTGVNSGAGFCRLYGSHEPFDAATLARLYPTHAGYVAKVKEVTERNLKAGYILKADADATIAEAEKSSVGRQVTSMVGCAALTRLTFEGNTTITGATSVGPGTLTTPAGQTLTRLPAFCRVVGVSRPTSDSNINFEVWLPSESWNGKFLSSGEGGYAGTPNYTRSGLDGGTDELIRRGYATASTDTGHLSTDQNWAIGHPERVTDYLHRSKHLVTVAAKGLIAAFYGKPPTHSYFNSCSNGGRQALMEAQRHPDDYDGLVVGAPWNYQSHSNAGFVWDAQTLSAPGAAIPASKLPAINAAAIAACDLADGLADNLIEDPSKCTFKPETMLCKGAESDTCLTPAQATALTKLYDGPRHPRTGASIFPGWARGSELGWTRLVASGNLGSLGRAYFGNLVFGKTDWDYRTFDFDKDLAIAESTVGSRGDAVNPDLSPAKRRGVKIIQYHGWNDQTLQPAYSPEYYERVTAAMGGPDKTRDFYRLFMVPGMAHCYFGPGANSFGALGQQLPPARDALHDIQTALENWVERGVAPDQFIATKYVDDAPQTTQVRFTRLLCPYPSVAQYKKTGDPNDAGSFVCVAR